MGRLASVRKVALFKKRAPAVPPDLAALRLREQELVARQSALEAEYLDTPDPHDGNQILRKVDELNAQIGVVRDAIKEFPR